MTLDPNRPVAFLFRDPVSTITHLFWCCWALYLTAMFWKLSPTDRVRRYTTVCFGLSMAVLYAASALYHALRLPPEQLRFFRLLDHSAIYVLIAGTYTPIVAVSLDGRMRTGMLVLVWTLASVGIALKWTLPLPRYGLTIGLYAAMASFGLLIAVPMKRAFGVRGLCIAGLGGMCYAIGGVCDALRWPVLYPYVFGSHEVLHVMDILGSLTRVCLMFGFVLNDGGRR